MTIQYVMIIDLQNHDNVTTIKNLWTNDNFCKKKEHGSMKMTAQINLQHLNNGCVTNPGSSSNGCVKRNYSHDSVCTTNYAEP